MIKYYAIYSLLFQTCGQDDKMLRDVKITEIAENTYHLQYEENNPYDGLDFKVEITDIPRDNLTDIKYHYRIYDSVYGDDAEIDLDVTDRA